VAAMAISGAPTRATALTPARMRSRMKGSSHI
jgi:hypothetical protein